jgi:FMN-dependent NADH-azoreductase
MSKVLYIQASPRVGRSHSIAVADAFIASYRESHRGDEIAKLNLFEARLPAFDGLRLQAKYSILHGQKPSPEELEAWKEIEAIIADFKSADKYVIAAPMWNFSLPYRLKQYLDILIQPTYTFSYTPAEGYKGLVANRPVFVAYARGGEYPAGSASEALDFQKRYLEMALGFIGLTDIRSVIVEPTLMGADIAAAKRSAAIAQAREMARSF